MWRSGGPSGTSSGQGPALHGSGEASECDRQIERRCSELGDEVLRLKAENDVLAKEKRKIAAKADKLQAKKNVLKGQLENSEAARKLAKDRCEKMFEHLNKDTSDPLQEDHGAASSCRPSSAHTERAQESEYAEPFFAQRHSLP